MTVVTSRSDFKNLSDLRLSEAKLLLDQDNWDGAYYLAGYAVECALKVLIIGEVINSESCPDRKFADAFYRHELTTLRKLAEVDDEMDEDAGVSPQWNIVKDWNEQTRYTLGKTEKEATDLYEAIEKGVLPWIKARW